MKARQKQKIREKIVRGEILDWKLGTLDKISEPLKFLAIASRKMSSWNLSYKQMKSRL